VFLQVKKQSLLQAVLKCKMNEKLHEKRGVANDIAAPLFYYELFNYSPRSQIVEQQVSR
jgi:hypothetical protein